MESEREGCEQGHKDGGQFKGVRVRNDTRNRKVGCDSQRKVETQNDEGQFKGDRVRNGTRNRKIG